MDGLLVGVVIAALGMGSLGVLAWRHEAHLVRFVARLAALALAALTVPFLVQGDGVTSVRLAWFPGSGTIALGLSAPGIHLAALAVWGLALAYVWRDGRMVHPSPGQHGLMFILCGLVVAALTVDHFLARAVLLDLVSLASVALLYLGLNGWRDAHWLVRRYLVFRLGDTLLLMMVLLLYRGTGSFHIEEAFTLAQALPAGQRVILVLAGLGATWIKLGLPPTCGWLLESTRLDAPGRMWLPAATLPLLGGYLLYCLGSLVLTLLSRDVLMAAGGALAVWSLYAASQRERPWRECADWLGVQGALGLMLLGTPWMRSYLWAFVPVRMALCALFRAEARGIQPTSLTEGIYDPLKWGMRALVGTTMWLEQNVLDGAVEGIQRGVGVAARTLQGQHRGQLRRNLLWASVALVVMVGLFMSWWAL